MSTTSSGPDAAMGLQFSVYPLRQDDIDAPIRAAISAAHEAGAPVRVGRLSTFAAGDEGTLFRRPAGRLRGGRGARPRGDDRHAHQRHAVRGDGRRDPGRAVTMPEPQPGHTETLAAQSQPSWTIGRLTSWSTREIVIAAVLAVAVGVVFWAWDLLWATAFSAVPFPVSYLLVGIWMVGGLLVPYVVRKPGAALVGELVAAFVSMILVNQWGAAVMLSGLVQGVGAEIIFGATRYRRYSLAVLLAAGALAGVFSIALDSFVYSYWHIYSVGSILAGFALVALSGALLGGALSKALADGLAKTGVLSGLAISKGERRRLG